MNIVKIFSIFLLLFIHMFVLGTSIMFFPMFGPCIRRIQPTFLAVLGPSFVDAHKFSRSFIFGDCRPILETFRDLSDAFIANRDK